MIHGALVPGRLGLWNDAPASQLRHYLVEYEPVAPTITLQPHHAMGVIGGTTNFTVAATGSAPLSYQWRKNGVNIPGATNASLTLTNIQVGDQGSYTVVVSNAAASVTSQIASLCTSLNELFSRRVSGPGVASDSGRFVKHDRDGNVIVAGFTVGAGSGMDYTTLKFDAAGNLLWTRTYNGPANGDDRINGLVVDAAGNAYVTGQSPGLVSGMDVATIKYAPNGGELWVRRFNGSLNGYDSGNAIALDGAGFVHVAGTTAAAPYADFLTLKYDTDGNLSATWADAGDGVGVRRFNGPSSGVDIANALAVDAAGNAYVAGESRGAAGNQDFAVVKYGPTGSQLWAASYAGAGFNDGIIAIAIDSAGNSYVAGASQNAAGVGSETYDIATVKFDFNGIPVWTNRYNGPGQGEDFSASLVLDFAGNVIVVGKSQGLAATGFDFVTLKYDAAGNPSATWPDLGDGAGVRRFDDAGYGSDVATGVVVDLANNVYVTGTQHTTFKYDANGNLVCVEHAPAGGYTASAISLFSNGNLVITGFGQDIGAGQDILTVFFSQFGWPAITMQPASQTVALGQPVTLNVAATGAATLTYQWRKNGVDIPGATGVSYTIPAAALADSGAYTVLVLNPVGGVSSATATLTVLDRTLRVISQSGIAGTTVAVPVQLIAPGNENAVAFSLAYDPAVLSFGGVSLGSGAAGGFLNVNASQTGSGRIGVLLALPAGTVFAPGVREAVVVSFTVAPLAPAGASSIVLGSAPVPAEVLGVSANALTTALVNGAVTVVTGSGAGFEADVLPTPFADGAVTLADLVQIGRYVAALDALPAGSLFQRVDTAPRVTLGDGQITLSDWVQAGRYAAGLDPLTIAGGPTMIGGGAMLRPAQTLARSRALQSGRRTVAVAAGPALAGGTTVVSLRMNASGIENGLAFSLQFDPAVLSPSAVLAGVDAAGATLLINMNAAALGRIGVAVALQPGAAFPAGVVEVARVKFVVKPGASGPAVIGFGDSPMAREVVDALAIAQPSGYAPGAVTIHASVAATAQRPGADGAFRFRLGLPGGELTQADADLLEVWVADSLLAPPSSWVRLTHSLVVRDGVVEVQDDRAPAPAPPPSGTVMRFYKVVRRP